MNSSKKEVIKFAKMLNDKKLSALRSGNISLRYKNGFLITPSGQKYSSLKEKDIVYVNLDGEYNKNQNPSSEWRFHQDIYNSKKTGSYSFLVPIISSVICSPTFVVILTPFIRFTFR